MAERIEEVRRGSWLPWAGVLAFAIGAVAAGWFIFADDIKSWTRTEDITWTPTTGERLTLVQHERRREHWVGEEDRVDSVTASFAWTVIPSAPAHVPGQAATWTLSLRSAQVDHRARDGTGEHFTWPLPDEDPPDLSALPAWAPMVGPILGLDLGTHITETGDDAVSVTPPEVLQQVAVRRDPSATPEAPLHEDAIRALHEDLHWFAENVATDLAGFEAGHTAHPGQVWTRQLQMSFGPWAAQPVHVAVHTTGYDGNAALIQARFSRGPTDAVANPEEGMSFLKGTAEYRFDVGSHRPIAGHLALQAHGKHERRFLTVDLEHNFALAGPGATPSVPEPWALPPVQAPAPTTPAP